MFEDLKKTRYLQYVAVLTATLSMTAHGTYSSWPSPTLPILASANNTPLEYPITIEEGSWIVSGHFLVTMPFIFVIGWLLDKFGRRLSLLMFGTTLAIPWLMIMFAKNAITIIAARSIAGIGIAVVIVATQIYSGEIADKDIRGRLSTILVAMNMMGSIVVYSAGPFVSYSALALICFAIPLLFLATFYFMPESPYFLVRAGKYEEAREVVVKLTSREDESNVEWKIEEIEKTVEKDMGNKSSFVELFTNRDYRKPLLVALGLKTFQQLNGCVAIRPYMQTIMEITETDISPELTSTLFGIVPLPAVIIVGAIVDKVGRKPLLMVSSVSSSLALIAGGIYFYNQDVLRSNLDTIKWLPATSLIAYHFALSLGVTTVPFVYFGEIFATNIKGQAVAFLSFYSRILIFFVSKYFYPLSVKAGLHATLWFFGGVCMTGAVFCYYFVPETKRKSFAEIQRKLQSRKGEEETEL